MSFLFFLLIIFLLFGWPLLRIWTAVRSARNRFNDMFGAASGAPRQHRQSSEPRRRHTKIITRDVGEYVEFEDLPGNGGGTASETKTTYTETTQVEDAEWEDIR